MEKDVKEKKGIGEIKWKRQKLTTYVSLNHFVSLKEISNRTQIPMGRLIDQALNEYFTEIGFQDSPVVAPIDKDFLRELLAAKE